MIRWIAVYIVIEMYSLGSTEPKNIEINIVQMVSAPKDL